ncbi:MAG TPA: Gfo/Idh/MocA family oxidoreductase [Streptosporangiaceae bacterium]|nr:Gfo/Idh/MocA family oxidoreductase [Streptosporangiaceae bacterium]
MTCSRPLRFGLVGTGHWARITHAPALAATPGVELTAVWGRNPEAAAALAAQHGATVHHDIGALLDDVDAVAFAVPPDVQAGIARRAAAAGKHLLLEKPLAIDRAQAEALVQEVGQAGVAALVFFTARYQEDVRAWLADVTARGPWTGGHATWLGSALREGSPYNTPWRRAKGGLWDLAPHLISLLWAALGPVTTVTADAGLADVTHLVLHHDSGAASALTVTLSAPGSAELLEVFIWGEPGRSAAPAESPDAVVPLRTALTELAAMARAGQVSHPCDIRFGYAVGRIVAEAQHHLNAARAAPPAK